MRLQAGVLSQIALVTSTSFVTTTPAIAQDSAASTTDTIVVTARRMEENIQDVPISITVFDQQALDNAGVTSAADLANYTPGLVANRRFGSDNTTFSIRGFYQELRTTASVAIYFADVIAPRGPSATASGDGAGPGEFFDLQNVQVLKGPQGTLFGRNTTGGAVLVVPKRPTDSFEGYLEGHYGNFDASRLQGVINLPLSESIRFRGGIDWNQRDGYLKNITGVGPGHFANTDYIAARASLLIDITPSIENYTIASYSKSEGRAPVAHLENAVPSSFPGFLAVEQLEREAGNGIYHVANRLPDAFNELETWRVLNTTTWNVSDNLSVKNIISYGELQNDLRSSQNGDNFLLGDTLRVQTPTGVASFPVPPQYQGLLIPFSAIESPPGGHFAHQSTFTEELRLQGSLFGDRLTWQAGVYYEKSSPLSVSGSISNNRIPCVRPLENLECTDVLPIIRGQPQGSSSISYGQTETWYENYAIYEQSTFAITDWLDFTGGFRYTWDDSRSTFNLYQVNFPAPNTPQVACSDGIPAGGITFADALNRIGCAGTARVKSKAPTWTVSLEAKPTDDLMTFIKYSRGYRAGSTNPNSLPGFKTFDDEKVDVYEIGLRWSGYLGAGRAYANITGYYNDFTNQQVQAGAFVLSIPNPNAVIINAGSSRMYGAEAEVGIEPFRNFRLTASYGYLNTLLKSLKFPGVLVNPGTPGYFLPFPAYDMRSNGPLTGPYIFPTSLPGTDLPLSPTHQVVVHASYTLPLPSSIGEVTIGGTYSYTSEQFDSFSNYPVGRLNPRNLVNANLTWKSIGGSSLDAMFVATNLFNEEYVTSVIDRSSSGFIGRNYGEPRMYSFALRYNFGGY